MRIAVVGMGKIGLPLAVQFAHKGHEVIGADFNVEVVDSVNSGRAPFPGEADLEKLLRSQIAAGRIRATTSTSEATSKSEVVVVVVPLVIDSAGHPDFSMMDAATHEVAMGLHPGTLVSFETTLPVGTTRQRLTPILEAGSELNCGTDFYVVFSPERVFSGRIFADLRRYPKLVGGVDAVSTQMGVDFYSKVLDFDERFDLAKPNGVWDLGSSESAEFAKLAETTYRDVNIALANQFALYAERSGMDLALIIEACNSQPYSHIHQPGIAVGGHCIPVYPRLLLWSAPEANLVELAREINESMPQRMVDRLIQTADSLSGKTVVVLGVAYRGGVKETAFSGVFPLIDALETRGAQVRVHDPLFNSHEIKGMGMIPFVRGGDADVVIVQADHPEYSEWGTDDIKGVQFVVDGRSIIDTAQWPDSLLLTVGNGVPSRKVPAANLDKSVGKPE